MALLLSCGFILLVNEQDQRFQIVLAFSCGSGESDLKMLCVYANFFENGGKKLRFQTKTDTCGRGLMDVYAASILIFGRFTFSFEVFFVS